MGGQQQRGGPAIHYEVALVPRSLIIKRVKIPPVLSTRIG